MKPWVSVIVKTFNYLKEQCQPERIKKSQFTLRKFIFAVFPGLCQTVIGYKETLEASFHSIPLLFSEIE